MAYLVTGCPGAPKTDRIFLTRRTAMNYDSYLTSDAWYRLVAEVLRLPQYECYICLRTRPLRAHHKTYARLGRERLSDLVVLCDTCHRKFHESLPQLTREQRALPLLSDLTKAA